GLRRGNASITIEPGGQFELSGAPLASIEQTRIELAGHFDELATISKPLGIRWIATGTHPTATLGDIPWMPKSRYAIMREYFVGRGAGSHHMMKRTCTVQANFDYENPEDGARKLRVAMKVGPFLSALFARSSISAGRKNKSISERSLIWLDTDPDRTGILGFVLDKDFRLEEYIEYALDVPMFLIIRDGENIDMTGWTFRDYFENRSHGFVPTVDDWEIHLSTLFPEVRIKKFIEVRGADAGPIPMMLALPAVWKGILYDGTALLAAEDVVRKLDHSGLRSAFKDLARKGLGVKTRAGTAIDVIRELLSISAEGLKSQRVEFDVSEDETAYLDPLREIASAGESRAQSVLREFVNDDASSIERYLAENEIL
ncbi:MAG: glutamate-cysteine ligase family protein, partial [Planctomycetes bacterium]|nr:glutamate-cysteine ligase family protein [Planctomycetota bacterium]